MKTGGFSLWEKRLFKEQQMLVKNESESTLKLDNRLSTSFSAFTLTESESSPKLDNRPSNTFGGLSLREKQAV